MSDAADLAAQAVSDTLAELARLCAIVSDLAREDPVMRRDTAADDGHCWFCYSAQVWKGTDWHDPSCPWLRATQEQP